jgi:hypothetical protein
MRTLLTIAIVLVGASASEAQQRGNAKRYHYAPNYYYAPRVESECERRARAEDPTGLYAGYPCWARETFGRGRGGRR